MKQIKDTAYWCDAFLKDELEGKTTESGIMLWALGGAAFVLRTPEATLYLDPYLGREPVEFPVGMHRTTMIPVDPDRISAADAAFITHSHYDHCHEETMQSLVRNTGLTFYGPDSVVKEASQYGLGDGRLSEVKVGGRVRVKDIEVTVYPGYDENEPAAVTYLIETGGIKLLFAGDSAAGPAFDEIGAEGLDIAMLAFGRTWYMSEEELLDASDRLDPRLLLPFHWEIWRGHRGDPLLFGKLIERRKPSYDAMLLLVGDCLIYKADGSYEKCA